MRRKTLTSIFAIPVCALLMSAASPSSYSNIYNGEKVNGTQLINTYGTGYLNTDKRNDRALDYTYNVELYEMNKISGSTVNFRVYSIITKFEIHLYDNVEYPNGLFDWFTGTTNISLANMTFKQRYTFENVTNYNIINDSYTEQRNVYVENGLKWYFLNEFNLTEQSLETASMAQGHVYITRDMFEPIALVDENGVGSTHMHFNYTTKDWNLAFQSGESGNNGRYMYATFRDSLPAGSKANTITIYDNFSFRSDTRPTSLNLNFGTINAIPVGSQKVGDKYTLNFNINKEFSI